MVKRILPWLNSIVTVASGVLDQARCASPTVLRGTITPGMPSAPFGTSRSYLRQAVAVGGDGARRRRLRGTCVQVDADGVIARLFGGDRKLRAINRPLASPSSRAMLLAYFARSEVGEIALAPSAA